MAGLTIPNKPAAQSAIACTELLCLMIEADREPINRQAARQLSRGTGELRTIEEALAVMGASVSGELASDFVRRCLENGNEAEYKLTVRKCNRSHGFNVILSASEKGKAKLCAHFTELA